MARSQFLSSWVLKEDEEKMLANCCEPNEAKKIIDELSYQKETGLDLMVQIGEFFNHEQWEKGIELIQKNIEDYPFNAELNNFLGLFLTFTGQHDKAIIEHLKAIEKVNSEPERLAFIIKLEDAMVLLAKDNSESEIKDVLIKLLEICGGNNKLEQLSALLSNVIFALLRSYNEIKPFRMEMLKDLFEELFVGKPEFTYPLRYFDIGFRYFVMEQKEAIYEMSQEERMVFEKFTSIESTN